MKVAFVGAGSFVFARALIGDLLSYPELADGSTLALMDIDAERLAVTARAAARVDADVQVQATLDRRAALAGADYVVTMMQVGGYRPATVTDFEVPKRFGLRQTIGDTLGIGGVMRGLRAIPVLLDICRDMEELCPDAVLLQYVNPMAMLCWAAARASSIRTVGLCHSVHGEFAVDLGIPRTSSNDICAGRQRLPEELSRAVAAARSSSRRPCPRTSVSSGATSTPCGSFMPSGPASRSPSTAT